MENFKAEKSEFSLEVRKNLFEKDLGELMKRYKLFLYAANVVMPNGEVIPTFKLADMQKNEDKTKRWDTTNQKASKDKNKS